MRTPIILAALALAMSAPAAHAQNAVKGGPETPSPSKCAGPDGKDAVAPACKGAGGGAAYARRRPRLSARLQGRVPRRPGQEGQGGQLQALTTVSLLAIAALHLDVSRLRERHGVMTSEAFHAAALALPGATFDIKWGVDRVYSVGGKMFAHAGIEGDPEPKYMFKTSDLAFELLVEQGLATPAPYLARAKWVQLVKSDALSDGDLEAYLKEAHRIVAAKLPAAVRAGLG